MLIAPFFADTLKTYRWRTQMTVEQVARRAHIEVEHLQALESGKCKAELHTMLNLGLALGVDPAALMNDVISRVRRHPNKAILATWLQTL